MISAISWPLVIVFVLLCFGQPLRAFVQNLGEFKLKAGPGGVEASLIKQQVEAAAYLQAATIQRGGDDSPGSRAEQAQGIANVVTEAVGPATIKQLANATILWVDDRPNNNVYERMALEALGIRFVISTSTDDAVEKLRAGRYDLVISDMGRPQDSQAGYTLLARVRDELNLQTAYLIYAGSSAPEHDAEARRRGGGAAAPVGGNGRAGCEPGGSERAGKRGTVECKRAGSDRVI